MKLNKPAIYLLLTLSILIMVSCNQAEKAGTALIPDNDYNVLLTVDFQEFFSSDIWEEVEDEIGELGVKQLFGELEKMLSVKLDDLETMVMAIELKPEVLAQGKQPESGLVYVEGDVDEGDVEDLLKEDPAKTDLDDDDIEGFDMLTWENNDAEKAVVFLKDGYLRGLQDDVEDAVDVMVKGGKSLVTSKNYAEYAELFSNSSTITLNVWQLDDILEDLLEIGQKGKLEEDDEDFMTSLEELTAASWLLVLMKLYLFL